LLIRNVACYYLVKWLGFGISEMEAEYQEHERRATDLSLEIGRLSAQMEEHLGVIREIEEYHGRCNP